MSTPALLRKIATLLNVEADSSHPVPVCRIDGLNAAADKMEAMEKALEAARLLCANLDNGGIGSARLVDNFRNFDDKVTQ